MSFTESYAKGPKDSFGASQGKDTACAVGLKLTP